MQTTTKPRIAYDDVGDGPTALVFLPGWCSNRTVFRDLLAGTARSHRAIALDWRGHGGSDLAPGDFTTDDLVDDAVAVVDDSGADLVIPVGLAHAGWVAIELRRRLGPERVPGIVLLDWMPLGPPPPFLDALAGLQDPDRWFEVRSQLFAMWTTGIDLPALDRQIAEMAAYDGPMWQRAGREIAARFTAAPSPVAVLEALEVPCPTLHLYAQPADEEVFAAQAAYATDHSWFEVERIPARSHFPMYEVPDLLADRIGAFATRCVDAAVQPA